MVLFGAALATSVSTGVYRYIILEITEVATDSKTSTHRTAFCVFLWVGAALPLSIQRLRVQLKIRLVRISLFTADFVFLIYFSARAKSAICTLVCRFVYVLAFV